MKQSNFKKVLIEKEVERLLKEGKTYGFIAEKVKCSFSTIRKIVMRISPLLEKKE